MLLDILPLAITMMAGPQILTSIVLLTNRRPVKASLGYLSGVALAVCTGLAIAFAVARLLGLHAEASGQPASGATTLQIILVGLLVLLSLRTYRNRKTAKPPKWLLGLEKVSPASAFKIGLLLIFVMPGDIVVMATVGVHLAANGIHASDVIKVLPFVAMTLLIASAPLLSYLLFRGPAERFMPKLQAWMQANSWLVNIIVYLFFIVLILN